MNFAASSKCDKCGSTKPSPQEMALVEGKQEASEEVNKVLDSYLRLQADLQNYRRNHTEAMSRAQVLGKQDALKKMLPLNEEIEQAMIEPEGMDDKDKGIFTSYSLLFRKISAVWAKAGVEAQTVEVGDKFDPKIHQKVEEREATEGEVPGTVLEVLKSGWKCEGQVIVPSAVAVVASPKVQETDQKEKGAEEEEEETEQEVDAKVDAEA